MARLRWLENARTGDEGTVCTHTNKLFFDDANAYINASASGTLDLVATTVAITGNQTISGDLAVTGGLTYGSETVSLNQSLQGTLTVGVSGTGYDVLFYGETATYQWLWDQNADTNGGVVMKGTWTCVGNAAITGTLTVTGNSTFIGTITANTQDNGLDVKFWGAAGTGYWLWDANGDTNGSMIIAGTVAITGATTITGNQQLTGTLTVGVDNTGHDVKMFGATTLKYWEWDESADQMNVVGTSSFTGAISITGTVGITGDVTMATQDQINFEDTATYIHASATNVLTIIGPTVAITATTGLIHYYDTASYVTQTVSDAGAVKVAVTGDSAGSYEIETDDGAITLDAAATINLDSGTGDIDTTNAFVISPTAAGTFIDFELETEWVSGTLINADFGGATTVDDDLVGMELDFNGNVTMTTNKDVTGHVVKLPAFTQSAANTTLVTGFDITTAGALVQDTLEGTITWKGFDVQLPNTTQTTGTVNSYGLYIAAGTVTSGTQVGIYIGSTLTTGIDINACAVGIDFSGACTTACISMDGATLANGDHEIEMRNTVAGDKTIIAAGTATDDAGIITAVGADDAIADGSLYLSATDGAGVLFIKKNDVWTAITTA